MCCDFDCFNCKFSDCVNDELQYEDYKQSDKFTKAAELDRLDNKQLNRKIRRKAYYEKNKDEISAYRKAYYEKNKDKVIAHNKAWKKANKDKVIAHNKAWFERKKLERIAKI